MSILGLLTYRFARFAMVLTAFLSLLFALHLVVFLVFDIPPYYRLNDSSVIGFSDFKKGIPLTAHGWGSVPDTSYHFEYHDKGGARMSTGRDYHYGELFPASRFDLEAEQRGDSLVYSDTIRAVFSAGIEADPSIKAVEISELKFFFWPRSFGKRLMLIFPVILSCLVMGFSAWQISRLMRDISRGEVFRKSGYRRLEWIGYALLLLQFLFFLLNFTEPFTHSYGVRFESTIPNYRVPLSLTGNLEQPFDLQWVAIGCIILVIARGFRKGDELQEDRDLTI